MPRFVLRHCLNIALRFDSLWVLTMGFRSQTGSRRSGQKFQKAPHEKSKHKTQKSKIKGQFAEETPVLSPQEILEKTAERLGKLGTQTFALSPFSQYFDDWLVNLRQVIAEFESYPGVNTDEAFTKERTQIFSDVEGELAKRRLQEAELNTSAKALADNNHLLVETDASYASQNREIAAKRNGEIERLTRIVQELESELSLAQKTKTNFLNPFAKNTKAQNVAAANQKLIASKSELEITVQNFAVEQEKLHDAYEKKKLEIMEKVRTLERQITDIEIDTSAPVRKATSESFIEAAEALLQRKTSSPR